MCGNRRKSNRETIVNNLIEETETLGKPAWRPMLRYVAELHARSTRPPRAPFPYPWEEIGPGYCYGPAFGHWDLVHASLDAMVSEPEHARQQLLNNLAAQEESGLLPGVIWMRDEEPRWSHEVSHPPVWPVAVQDYCTLTGSDDLIQRCYGPLVQQIRWFEENRAALGGGFFYRDILTFQWESGVDEGVRFFEAQPGAYACVDASAHMFGVYQHAAAWSSLAGKAGGSAPHRGEWLEKADALREFIQTRLWDVDSGWYYDVWAVDRPETRHLAFEGMFPLVMGAATPEQARRVIAENLLNPRRFFSSHPISTVGVEDPLFELRMWRGPAWNSMTYWAVRGCLGYEQALGSLTVTAAHALLEPALDNSAAQFDRTGTVWEFYHPHGGRPEDVQRKPHTSYNQPCRDYLGHNPLIAMARLWDRSA